MEGLINTFHIDWKLMLAQTINFGLVFAVLYLLAAKPLSKLIKERTDEINTGLENAKKAETEVANANIKREEIIREAKNDAKGIISTSQTEGKDIVKEAKDKAILEKEEIVKQAKLDAEKERKQASDSLQKEASVLVADGIQKIIEGYVAKGHGEDIIKGIIKG